MEKTFKKLTGVLPIEIAEIGDYVQFGKIAWKAIAIEDGNKLLLSKEWMVMDTDEDIEQNSLEELLKEIAEEHTEEDYIDNDLAFLYSEDYFKKKYRACKSDYDSIQKYLREGFCEEYFSPDDIKRIVPYSIETKDQIVSESVFLLSRDEVEKYIPKKEDRIATAVWHIFDFKKPWLLRFNEDEERYYFAVDTEGNIVVVDGHCDKFRPAVWVK